ncbi:response regulator transcription factor [Actinoplanes sp. TRM 88003]|uniref:Response regulator transcription factor n=1 Tax=Paractinoplanes aksuensis TaxID=2939490 RepID=A0ABT1DIB3_9ACTN|nr:response regulator transcription factor [Actinoplanes aksuensis]MCO8270524.1 response regulator transcription factor [Actinoplanes aksuensis]
MTSVLVADDQILVRAGLAALIRAAPGFEVVGEAADGRQAIDLAAALRPQVVLMDIRMPGIDGVAATARILAGPRPAPRVLVLTTFDLDEYIYAALRAGASGFLLKETPPERLLSAIRTVAEGDTLLTPSVTRRLVEAFVPPVRAAPELSPLTAREIEILRLVGSGRTNAAIAEALVVSEATVKTHLARLMGKLALSSRAQVVVTAYETGLIVPGRREV